MMSMKQHKQLNAIEFNWKQMHQAQERAKMNLVREHLVEKLPDHMAILLRWWLMNETA